MSHNNILLPFCYRIRNIIREETREDKSREKDDWKRKQSAKAKKKCQQNDKNLFKRQLSKPL